MDDAKIGSVNIDKIYIGSTQYWQREVAPTIYVSDDFNRADSATTLGNAVTGQAWTYTSSTWGISNNTAYSVTTTAAHKRAIVESGVSDCAISVKVTAFTANDGFRMLFRYLDTNNEWMIFQQSGYYRVSKRVGGTLTGLFTSTIPVVVGDVLKAVCNGANIKTYINDVLMYETNDAALQTATKHGIEVYTGNATRFDDFSVTPIT